MITRAKEYKIIYDEEDIIKVNDIIIDFYVQNILKDKNLLMKILTPK